MATSLLDPYQHTPLFADPPPPPPSSALQVYGLPSLSLIMDMPVSRLVEYEWGWDARHDARPGRALSCSRHGHVALLGKGNELLRWGAAAPVLPHTCALAFCVLACCAAAEVLALHLRTSCCKLRSQQHTVAPACAP